MSTVRTALRYVNLEFGGFYFILPSFMKFYFTMAYRNYYDSVSRL